MSWKHLKCCLCSELFCYFSRLLASYSFKSLDALERQEEERVERLQHTVLPTAPDPLGLDLAASSERQTGPTAAQRAALLQQPPVDLKTLPPRPRFWDKYKDLHSELMSSVDSGCPSVERAEKSDSRRRLSEMEVSIDADSELCCNEELPEPIQ